MTSNYWVVNINDFIDPKNLEYFLRSELESVRLTEDFEYGIYNCDSEENGPTANTSAFKALLTKGRLPHLPLRNSFLHDSYLYYFGVRFPTATRR
ncbi:MAG: hypothetical protein IPN76_19655 [Saprospiraceae bacterium]|nr:hypothetical protein [Saprospiraceae bacterium]